MAVYQTTKPIVCIFILNLFYFLNVLFDVLFTHLYSVDVHEEMISLFISFLFVKQVKPIWTIFGSFLLTKCYSAFIFYLFNNE